MIREARINDVGDIVRLWEKCNITDPERGSIITLGLIEKINLHPDMVIVWEENEKIVGVVAGLPDPMGSLVRRLAVDPEWRGKKIGQKLIEELMKRFEARGVHSFAAEVEDLNAPSGRTLENLGFFRRTGTSYSIYVRPNPYADREQSKK
jgi:N-acetylglutamate synthase-like GNAT family acetyltransferase